jgi:hypothetical protein
VQRTAAGRYSESMLFDRRSRARPWRRRGFNVTSSTEIPAF